MVVKYYLAQLNIARFRLPQEHPSNTDFVENLDRVNALAEAQPGFVWRLVGEGNDALDLRAFDDPNIAINMSVWTDMESLANFVYRNEDHREIMRRRREWFDKMDFYLVLWWIPEHHLPTIEEAQEKLSLLEQDGPSSEAFTFRHPYPNPDGDLINPVLDECA